MSCLNLRFPPARKAWRSFTSKLQSKLHKLNKSKNIRKTRHTFSPSSASTKSVAIRPSALFDHSKKRQLFDPFKPQKNRKRFFFKRKKKTAPVYIDKLFIGPVTGDQEVAVKCPSRGKIMKMARMAHKEEGQASEREVQGDTMWESLGFGSPQMRGIDQRAEQFIASFRAEMEIQEMIERNLSNNNDSS